jgi:hypothetical protein
METEIAIRDTVHDAHDKMIDGRRRRRSTETSDEVTSGDERAPADEPPVKSESVVLLAHDTARNGKRQKMPDARSGGPADARAGKQRYTELSDMVGNIIADRDRLAAELDSLSETRDECEGIVDSLIDQLKSAGIKHRV